MKRLLFSTLLLLICTVSIATAQIYGPSIVYVTVDPTGGCAPGYNTQNTVTGVQKACIGGVWISINGGGAPGSVTSVTIAGTANQITASGTCTVTTSGTCTLSLPSAITLPGTINKITLTAPTTAWTLTPAADNQTTTIPTGTLAALGGTNTWTAPQTIQPAADGTGVFCVKNQAGTVNTFCVDTTNQRIIIGNPVTPSANMALVGVAGTNTGNFKIIGNRTAYGDITGQWLTTAAGGANSDNVKISVDSGFIQIVPANNYIMFGGATASFPAWTWTSQTNPIMILGDGARGTTGQLAIPFIESASGQRFVCVTTTGLLVSSTTACVGT